MIPVGMLSFDRLADRYQRDGGDHQPRRVCPRESLGRWTGRGHAVSERVDPGEYDKGIANLPDDDTRRALYTTTRDSLASRFSDRLISVSDAVVRRWGTISGTVRRQTGHPPPVIDTLMAATALEHDLYLVTRNVRDVRHSGAAIFRAVSG